MLGIIVQLENQHGRSSVGDVEDVALSEMTVESGASPDKGFNCCIVGVWIVPLGGFVEEIGDDSTGHGGGRS